MKVFAFIITQSNENTLRVILPLCGEYSAGALDLWYILQTRMHLCHFGYIVGLRQKIHSLADHTNPPV